jgi:protein-L-isoaspartate(D-aspartate) O-methyltransferase
VRSLGPAFFVWGEGQPASDREALEAAFERGGIEFVRSLRWQQPADPARSWFIGEGWSLGYEEPG